MTKYNYLEAVKEDIKEYMKENNITEITEDLYDTLFIKDSVTGNMSGSYTFSTYEAEQNLCYNMSLLKEACNEFGADYELDNPEACDVTIRCYVLRQALEELEKEMN